MIKTAAFLLMLQFIFSLIEKWKIITVKFISVFKKYNQVEFLKVFKSELNLDYTGDVLFIWADIFYFK